MTRRILDVQWPEWMAERMPLERWERWTEFFGNSSINLEEFEENGTYVIRAEVPGIDPDKDVELTVADGALRLKVHRARQSQNGDRTHFRSEFEYGSLQRFILLPASATETDVKATYRDGILEVRLPMNGSTAREHRVAIARG